MPKKYISDNAELMKEWDWEANTKEGLDPTQLSWGSNKKAHWICSKGHKWSAKISKRLPGDLNDLVLCHADMDVRQLCTLFLRLKKAAGSAHGGKRGACEGKKRVSDHFRFLSAVIHTLCGSDKKTLP